MVNICLELYIILLSGIFSLRFLVGDGELLDKLEYLKLWDLDKIKTLS